MSLFRLNDDLPSKGVQAFGMKKGGPVDGKEESQALDALSKFIPTEMLAPYFVFLAYAAQNNTLSSEKVYLWFVIATPILAIIFQYAACARAEKPCPAMRAVIWRAIAATVAFAVWALAPPGSAFQAEIGGVYAAMAAVVVSPVLAAVDAIVLRQMDIITREAR